MSSGLSTWLGEFSLFESIGWLKSKIPIFIASLVAKYSHVTWDWPPMALLWPVESGSGNREAEMQENHSGSGLWPHPFSGEQQDPVFGVQC